MLLSTMWRTPIIEIQGTRRGGLGNILVQSYIFLLKSEDEARIGGLGNKVVFGPQNQDRWFRK